MSGALSLPVELTLRAFESFNPQELVRLSHVCRYWRTTARDCFAFWRQIQCDTASDHACQFFLARLAHKATAGIRIELRIPAGSGRGNVDEVIDGLVSNMHRVDSLALEFSPDSEDKVRCILGSAAALLRSLCLCWESPTPGHPVFALPTNIFQNNCHELRSIAFTNVTLPGELVGALKGTKSALINFNQDVRAVPSDLFSYFPAIQYVEFAGCAIPTAGSFQNIHQTLQHVQIRSLHGNFVSALEPYGATIRRIVVSWPVPEAIPALFGHFGDKASLLAYIGNQPLDDTHALRVVYTDAQNTMQREIVIAIPASLLGCFDSVFGCRLFPPVLLSRITTLRVSLENLWAMPVDTRLDACTDFVLIECTPTQLSHYCQDVQSPDRDAPTIWAPKLREITFHFDVDERPPYPNSKDPLVLISHLFGDAIAAVGTPLTIVVPHATKYPKSRRFASASISPLPVLWDN